MCPNKKRTSKQIFITQQKLVSFVWNFLYNKCKSIQAEWRVSLEINDAQWRQFYWHLKYITEHVKFTTQQVRIAGVISVSRSYVVRFCKFQFCEFLVHFLDLIPAPQLNQPSTFWAIRVLLFLPQPVIHTPQYCFVCKLFKDARNHFFRNFLMNFFAP